MKNRTIFLTACVCIIMQAALTYSVAVATISSTTVYRTTDCQNGYGGAFTISMFDAGGCIYKIIGIDCDGKDILWIGRVLPRGGDLPYSYTHYFSGAINGQPWFAKVQLNEIGQVTKAWGQVASGEYYEFEPTITP